MGGHLIATYCRFSNDDRSNVVMHDCSTYPKYLLGRVDKTYETFVRLSASHADDEMVRVMLFGEQEAQALKPYALKLGVPEERLVVDSSCRSIEQMVTRIWKMIRNDANPPRVYFVLSNWQWIFVEPLLKLKNDRFKFFFEGALDDRLPQQIEAEKKLEKVAKINLKEAKLDNVMETLGSGISENLKG